MNADDTVRPIIGEGESSNLRAAEDVEANSLYEFWSKTHIVVFGGGNRDLIENTLDKVLINAVCPVRLSIISALDVSERFRQESNEKCLVDVYEQCSDYYEIFSALRDRVKGTTKDQVLFLPAGIILNAESWKDLAAVDLSESGFGVFFKEQLPDTYFDSRATLLELLTAPWMPGAVVVKRDRLLDVGGVRPEFSFFFLWELLIRLAVKTPVVVPCKHLEGCVENEGAWSMNPIRDYYSYLQISHPQRSEDFPRNIDGEWENTKAILQMAVIEGHRELFTENVSGVLLEVERKKRQVAKFFRYSLRRLERIHSRKTERAVERVKEVVNAKGRHLLEKREQFIDKLREARMASEEKLRVKISEIEKNNAHLKNKLAEAEQAYARCKVKKQEALDAYKKKKTELDVLLAHLEATYVPQEF